MSPVNSRSKGGAVEAMSDDSVNHPKHYVSHPAGIECIDIVEHFSFNIGNAVKYLWRAGLKGDKLEDLKKARWYVDRAISQLEGKSGEPANAGAKR